MIEFLARKFIPHHEDLNDSAVRASYGTLCSVTAIIFNVLLFAAKFIIGRAAGSVSITADAVNNLTDAGSAVLVLLGFRLANRRPDPDHPFGHGRIEYVAGLVVAALILITGVELLRSSAEKILHPEPIEFSVAAVAVLALAIAVKFYMASFTSRVAKKIDSAAMEATAADYRSDSVSTAVVLLCMLLFRFAGRNLDAWGGLIVSALIIKTGIEEGSNTLSQLLGEKGSPETAAQVEEVLREFPEIIGLHDMIIHDYGPGRLFISVHAEVDGRGNVYELHDAMDRAMNELDARIGCESVIHMDPLDTENEELNALREEVKAMAKELDPQCMVHDFRMVPGPTHTNLIFDVMVPHAFRMSDEEVRSAISDKVKERHSGYFCVIKVDKAYV